jgi:uncharacterized membrane protein YjjP (DUF1212 family)
MIQRKQTLFLLLAAILCLVCLLVRLQWIDCLLACVAVLAVYTVFQYRKRIRQARLCLVGLFGLLAWYVLLAVIQGYADVIDSLPMVAAILTFMARKGILDDEKLVRAADRIR